MDNLKKHDIKVELLIKELFDCDPRSTEPDEIQKIDSKLSKEWERYQRAYNEYILLATGADLHAAIARRGELLQSIAERRQELIKYAYESLKTNAQRYPESGAAAASPTSPHKPKRSSRSSTIKLQLERSRIESELQKAEDELQATIRDLRNQVTQQSKSLIETRSKRKPKPLPASTPLQERSKSLPDGYPLPFSSIQHTAYPDNFSSLDQTLASTLIHMNQQLVGVAKQNAEATMVMKTMLQRQGVPKPNPRKFSGDPSQFPTFKKRIHDWIEEKGFTEREKISHLLNFVEGDAKDAIEHCETDDNGYEEAMDILEEKFGHPSKVVRSCLQKVTQGPRIDKGDKQALTSLENQLRNCLKVLNSNERYIHEMNASSNIERLVDRLPQHMQIDWAKQVPKIRDESPAGPSLNHLLELLNKQLRIMNDPQFGHIVTKTKSTKTPEQPTPLPRRHIPTLATSIDAKNDAALDKKCPCCHKDHLLKECDAFEGKAIEERWQLVKEKRLCHICLRRGHMKAQCLSMEKCACKATFSHHKLLHRDIQRTPVQEDQCESKPVEAIQERQEVDTLATLTQKSSHVVLLHVVPVKVISNEGKSLSTYGLLDNASRGTIISPELATKLDIDGPTRPITLTTVLGRTDCEFKEVSFKLQSAENAPDRPVLTVREGLVKDLPINERILPHEINYLEHPHLSEINVPEVEVPKVSLIIGQDVRDAHIVKEVKVSSNQVESGLYATRTALGWTVAGPLEGRTPRQREVDVNFTDHDRLLRERVDAFWTIENAGLDWDKKASVEDRRAEDILKETTRFNNGRYETGLLWKDDNPRLPDNRGVAETRLKSLRRKFQRDTDFEEKYRKVMEEYIERGYARKLSADEAKKRSPKTNYLPTPRSNKSKQAWQGQSRI